jgi:hypothetical protein
MLSSIFSAARGRVILGFAALSIAGSGLALADTTTTSSTVWVNRAPTITGTPSLNTTVGKAYSFNPVAVDPDGTRLAFSVRNLPRWATFNAATGAISGTPTVPGTFANITINVADGKNLVTFPAFTITVSPVVYGNAALSWKAPVEDEYGYPLADLAGYRVMYGTSPTAMTQKLEVPSAAMTAVSIEDLSSGTYYFTVTAYTKSGLESAPSEVVYKTIM